ncbi:MAG: hypothetical protein KC457_16785, partial [Myxococcales bacterium]|nr:hypothetical protein [Myxococcales bacterium]
MSDMPATEPQPTSAVTEEETVDVERPAVGAPTGVSVARQFLMGLACVLLLIDLVLGAVPRPADETPQRAADLHALLLEIGGATEPTYLLLGDSVLVGDTAKDRQADWRERRIVDYLRREAGTKVDFHQAAYSGLLPIDMLAMVETLDDLDPDASVALIIELSPRYFSPRYAAQTEHSRPWFAELGGGDNGPDFAARRAQALAFVRHHAPIYRHRALFRGARGTLSGAGQDEHEGAEDEDAGAGDRAEAFARLSVHYRDPVVGEGSLQARAIADIAARCRASGRKVAFVATPVEDEFLARAQDERTQGDYLGDLARLIEPDGQQISLLPMDHPLFSSALFWDHVHLRPEGHRLWAINVLVQLGIPLEHLPPRQELITLDEVDESLVARVDQGYVDGASWQA